MNQRIQDQTHDPMLLPDHPQHIGGADIAGAVLTDVDALHPGDEEPEGNRSQQESEKRAEPELHVRA
jgi:hypothetical protein